MTEEFTPANREEAMQRLKELALDHLGLPRPKQAANVQTLQDELLPTFMDVARHASLASSPLPLKTGVPPTALTPSVYSHLERATKTNPEEIRKLTYILQELGVHALFEAVASSPDVAMVGELPVDPYDVRLLREAGHRNPHAAVRDFLRYAASRPRVLSDSEAELERAANAMLQAHNDINVIINLNVPPKAAAPGAGATAAAPGAGGTAKPKRMKLFSGLGKIASGLVLLSGNAICIPTLTIGELTALPVLGSLAAGIAAVGEGVGSFLREGE